LNICTFKSTQAEFLASLPPDNAYRIMTSLLCVHFIHLMQGTPKGSMSPFRSIVFGSEKL